MKSMIGKLNIKSLVLLLITLAGIGSVFIMEPIPQDPNYHLFADCRHISFIPNFWNVVSNIPLLIVGMLGIFLLLPKKQNGAIQELWLNNLVFFIGIFLIGIGSGYYHWNPNSESLVWDRLPMTISFMAFFSIIIGESVSIKSGKQILWALILMGFMSIAYWQMTESRGRGDLRFYALVQFLPMVLISIILGMYKVNRNLKIYFWLVLLSYAIAKLFETGDYYVFTSTNLISGHSIKHVMAALGPLIYLAVLYKRKNSEKTKTKPII